MVMEQLTEKEQASLRRAEAYPPKIEIYVYHLHKRMILCKYVGKTYYQDLPHFGGISVEPGDYVSQDNTQVRSVRWVSSNGAIWKAAT
jgi:hypothetical protein